MTGFRVDPETKIKGVAALVWVARWAILDRPDVIRPRTLTSAGGTPKCTGSTERSRAGVHWWHPSTRNYSVAHNILIGWITLKSMELVCLSSD